MGELLPTTARPGATGGAFLGWKGLQSEVYFVPKGANPDDIGGGEDETIQLDYVEMAVMLRVQAGPAYLMAGPPFGVQLRCYAVLQEDRYGIGGNCEDLDGANAFESVDYSGVLSVGLNLAKLLTLDLRMMAGLAGISSVPALEDMTNRSYSFTARLPFGGR
jgi:hypothetical protein